MKRMLLLMVVFGLPLLLIAQEKPVEWKQGAIEQEKDGFSITIIGKIAAGWYVYHPSQTFDGLETASISSGNDMFVKIGTASFTGRPVSINDKVFSNTQQVYKNVISFQQRFSVKKPVPAVCRIIISAYVSDGEQFLPVSEVMEVPVPGGVVNNTPANLTIRNVNLKKPLSGCGDALVSDDSLFAVFLKGMAGGLIALLMPCLFPMIPVTVSFFTKRSNTRKRAISNGILYGLSILGIYLVSSLPFHFLQNLDSQVFNRISTNAWVNVGFFIVFVLFAISLFGLFELKLPSSFANKAGAKPGIFFMALTLVIVSFSCTGPILGALLVGSLSGSDSAWKLTIGMGGFGLALALPYALFAIFPQAMKALPKSGDWLDIVKKSLAFIELAFAIKFLSNADLVEHWGFLKREVFIALWIVIALALAMYLWGFLSFRQRPQKISWTTRLIGMVPFLFAVYLTTGIIPAAQNRLILLSGFAPPAHYSIYDKSNTADGQVVPQFINDYQSALALARQTGKPLLIDFTGWACVNCRKMEEQVWTQAEISSMIKDKFILVSLYVDDRQRLPAEEQFSIAHRTIETVGDKWAMFQEVNFKAASQPMYVMLTPQEELMNLPVGYQTARSYKEWLECGLNSRPTASLKSSR